MSFKYTLTRRQREVWELVEEQGKDIEAAARQLGIAKKTAEGHLRKARAAWVALLKSSSIF